MPVTLPPIFPQTRSGRTFFVAATILGVLAGAQLIALGVHLVAVARRPMPSVTIAATPTPVPLAAVPQPTPLAVAAPTPAPPSAATPTPEPPTLPTIARPTPAIAERNPSNPNDLLEEARTFRQNGDTNSALARLRDALAIAPDSPMLIAETALTYEAMGLNDKAFEQWQRLYDLGESIGALYYMAEARIHRVGPSDAPGAAPPNPERNAVMTNGGGNDGFQENAVLKITNLTLDEVNDPEAEKKLSLKIAVKNKPGFMVDPRRVKIEARFYDLIDGKDIVITNAVTGFAWLTAPVNWANDETEILETTYLRPKVDPAAAAAAAAAAASPTPSPTPAPRSRHGHKPPKAAEPTPIPSPSPAPSPTPAPVRTYLGYSVCVYYNGTLQDQQAAPISLLQKFPPPLTLESP